MRLRMPSTYSEAGLSSLAWAAVLRWSGMNAKNNRVKTNRQTKCSAHQCQTCRATQSFLQMPISGEGLPWIPPSAIIDISATVVLMFWCAQATSMLRQCWMRTTVQQNHIMATNLGTLLWSNVHAEPECKYIITHILYIHTSVYTIKRLDHRTDCPSHSVGLCARAKCKGVFRGNGLGTSRPRKSSSKPALGLSGSLGILKVKPCKFCWSSLSESMSSADSIHGHLVRASETYCETSMWNHSTVLLKVQAYSLPFLGSATLRGPCSS